MDRPNPLMALCLGYSSPSSSAAATNSWNPLNDAVRGLESKLSQIQKVLERAGWNAWIEREDDEVWSWLENVRLLEEEICLELEKSQPEIAEAVRQYPAPAVKVLYSIPLVRSCIKRNLKEQGRILLKIKELSEKIKSGFKDDDVGKFNNLSYPDSESAKRNKRPLTTSELRVSPVRGQESEKDSLLDLLFPTPGKARDAINFIAIIGGEGSGKTTVAQMVYNDERVRDSFQVRKWVCIASSFGAKILRKEFPFWDGKRYGQNFLSGKRFLLVLDDIMRDFLRIRLTCKSLLEQGAPGSRILVTTKSGFLVPGHKHHLSGLSTSDCWSILKRTALSGKPQLHSQVRHIGRIFARECSGLPLAAKIVGDYLKSKATAQEWEEALSDDIWQLKEISRLLYPVEFSKYDRLSPLLKQCFSYCAVFPKGCHINVERLVALWEAIGYVGDDVLRSFIDEEWILTKVTKSIHKNKILSCKFYKEGLYDVARFAAPEYTMIEQLKNLDSEPQSLRCFVIFSHCKLLPRNLFRRLKDVNALVLSSCKLEQLSSEVGSLTHLKFLDLSGNPLKLLPETIGDLNCLESLYLHSCYVLLSLPERIGDLEHLRHLRINHTADELHNLPQRFEELTSIRTLDVFRAGGTYGNNIGKLKKLNDLVDIRIAVHGEVSFSDADLESKIKLENLELSFVGKGRDQEMASCVEKLVPPLNLEMLLIEDYHGLKLPMWILAESLINKLKRLSLRSNVSISTLPALWKLSSLEFLWLYDMPEITHLGCEFFGLSKIQHLELQISSDDEAEEFYSDDEDVQRETNCEITKERRGKKEEEVTFRSLKTLRIEYLENLSKWEDVDELYEKQIMVMPSLEELIISDCSKLQGRPLRILRDTPWFDINATWKGRYSYKYDQVVDVGDQHDSNIQKFEDLKDYNPIRVAIHGKDHFLGSNLKKKPGMTHLELCFVGDGRDQETALCIEEMVPPPNLERLRIDDYPGLRLPKWFLVDSIMNNLRRLSVRSCTKISSFPRLWKLSRLKFLWLFDIPCMKYLGCEFFGFPNKREQRFLKQSYPMDADGSERESTDDNNDSEDNEEIGDGHVAFPCLETLRIEYMQNWEEWEDVDEADVKRINVMPSLEELIIADCPKLQVMPLRILRDTPWLKEKPYGQLLHTKYQTDDKPSTSAGKAVETEHQLHQINDQANDKPSTSRGNAVEIEHYGQLHQINDQTIGTSRGNAVEIEHHSQLHQINDQTNDKPSISRGNTVEIEHHSQLHQINDQTNDKPSTSRGNAVEIEHHSQLQQINDQTTDKPGTSRGYAEIGHYGQLHEINVLTNDNPITSRGKESDEIEPADD